MRPSGDDLDKRGSIRVSLVVVPSDSADDPARRLEPYQADLENRPEIESVEVLFAPDPGTKGQAVSLPATGDWIVVLDPERGYAPEAVFAVLRPLWEGKADLAVAVNGSRGPIWRPLVWIHFGLGLVSRLVLGTADLCSGLFAASRSTWESAHGRTHPPDLGVILGKQTREIDVPVRVDERFEAQGLDMGDLKGLKKLLDGRHGNLSRLVQFCIVGASGMVVDLSMYALLQLVFSYTALATRRSALFGVTWHLVVSSALAIATALVWNFSLNRRLTFSYARGGPVVRQFFKYALSNALAVALSFTLRLYLPSRVAFFARHRLAAALVGIVAATGLSFSMSRWIVFSNAADRPRSTPRPHEAAPAEPSSVVV